MNSVAVDLDGSLMELLPRPAEGGGLGSSGCCSQGPLRPLGDCRRGEAHKGGGEETGWRIVTRSWENQTQKWVRAGVRSTPIDTVSASWDETLISLQT